MAGLNHSQSGMWEVGFHFSFLVSDQLLDAKVGMSRLTCAPAPNAYKK